ncbi:hypothetical protein TIFTF001_025031 [Ficus carica]|uniref:F-box associated beta-propeller type 1 domain-containing protein n=1 Tax=Ficus carica TaxID=3494 RepID=A0AA88DF92_FICCA|nr:hypothetical protein TIFTF001_025031 [Ficus carica]
MACLPWEMTAEILCRLPVKDLLRFRTATTNTSWVDLDLLDRAVKLPNPAVKAMTIFHGVKKRIPITEVLGSCNGLLALNSCQNDAVIVLWNPSTRMFRKVELPRLEELDQRVSLHGFGHDNVNDDYKLVRISLSYYQSKIGNFDRSRVYVYSAKSNTWSFKTTTTRGFFYFVRESMSYDRGILSNNSLHWLALRTPHDFSLASLYRDLLIVSFGFVTEEFREIPLPDCANGSELDSVHMDEIRGSLCIVLLYTKREPRANYVDVWVMKEYESWTKLCVVGLSTESISYFDFMIPVASLKKNIILLNESFERLIAYNIERRVKSDVRISNFPKNFNANICVGSLVRLDNDGDDGMLSWKPVEEYGKKYRKPRRRLR